MTHPQVGTSQGLIRQWLCRLEAEMAALDVGELLQQKVAIEAAVQAEALKSASLQAQVVKVETKSFSPNISVKEY